MKIIFYIIITIIISSCNNYLPGFDFDNFNNTPLENLSKAVKEENVSKIEDIVNLTNIDYKEPKYGHSLLMLAVANNLEESVNKLLELGANPNLKSSLKDNEDSSYYNTPLFIVCNQDLNQQNCNTNILSSLISYGANVNDKIEIEYIGANYKSFRTPLEEACKSKCLLIVKKLIESGANANNYTYLEGHGPLTNSIIYDRMEILRYLIIDVKVNIPRYCYVVQAHNETPRKEYSLTEMLLKKDYKKGSKEFKIRSEILEYLKNNNTLTQTL